MYGVHARTHSHPPPHTHTHTRTLSHVFKQALHKKHDSHETKAMQSLGQKRQPCNSNTTEGSQWSALGTTHPTTNACQVPGQGSRHMSRPQDPR
jgi:hypothetical protein